MIVLLSLIVYATAILFILMVFSVAGVDTIPQLLRPLSYETSKNLVGPLILLFGLYPIAFALIAMWLLVSNLLFSRDYEAMYSWHRNSLLNLLTTMIFCSSVTPCLMRIHGMVIHEDFIMDRGIMHRALLPIAILNVLIFIMVSCYLAWLIDLDLGWMREAQEYVLLGHNQPLHASSILPRLFQKRRDTERASGHSSVYCPLLCGPLLHLHLSQEEAD